MDQMGSPYVMAHGLGTAVADANTTVTVPESGDYHVWVRTRDWVGQWKTPNTSMQWNSVKTDFPSSFPACLWAVQFDGRTAIRTTKGDWNWETGADRDQVKEIEHIRDYALRGP